MKYDAVVVGGGIAGLTAAAYLARAGKSVILFERQSKVADWCRLSTEMEFISTAG